MGRMLNPKKEIRHPGSSPQQTILYSSRTCFVKLMALRVAHSSNGHSSKATTVSRPFNG
jgi:hypothetical protein